MSSCDVSVKWVNPKLTHILDYFKYSRTSTKIGCIYYYYYLFYLHYNVKQKCRTQSARCVQL